MAKRAPILTPPRRMTEINLTPLMDLTFILLITFIITFPLIEQGIPVNLPQGKARDLSADKSRTVTVDEHGATWMDHQRLELDELRARMVELMATFPDTTVLVRADERIRYGELVKVLKVLHDARISRMALVTRAEQGAAP